MSAFALVPCGLDFLFTFLLTHPFGFDESLGLLRIDAWRLLTLDVIFAFGCRLWARSLPLSVSSADFVFVVTLFTGAAAFVVSPLLLVSNCLVPWVLLCLTKLVFESQDRAVFYAFGLTIGVSMSLGLLFDVSMVPVLCALAAYGVGLASSEHRRLLGANLRHTWSDFRGKLVLGSLAAILVVSILPPSLGGSIAPRDGIGWGGAATTHHWTVGTSITLHPLGILFGIPNPSDRSAPPGASRVVPVAGTIYGSTLGALLLGIGAWRGRHRCRPPLLVAVVLLVCAGLLSPAIKALVFITPFLAMLAAIGMEHLLSTEPEPLSREREIRQVLAMLGLSVTGLFLFALAMVLSPGFGSRHQGTVLSLIFFLLSWLAVTGKLALPTGVSRTRLFMIIVLLDLATFLHLAGHGAWMGYADAMLPAPSVTVSSPTSLQLILLGFLWAVTLALAVVWFRMRPSSGGLRS
jgi:hypothetical protein